MKEPQVLVTGRYFSGRGLRAIEPVLEELISSAQEEIHIAAYLIAGSFVRLLDLLEAALERGVKVHLLLNRLDDHPPDLQHRLSALKTRFAHARITYFQDSEGRQLHAK